MPTVFPRGIYAILDLDRVAPLMPDDPDAEAAFLLRYITDALQAGAVAVQLRAKSVPGHSLWLPTMVQTLRSQVPDSVPLIVNDHIDALVPIPDKKGLGVHVGQDDLPPQHARSRLGEDVLIGWSTHNMDQVAAVAAVAPDYIGFGPIHETDSKRDADPATGWDQLQQVVAATDVPVVAIGGLDTDDIANVVGSGAHCAAVISAWLGDDGAPNGPNFARMAMQDLVGAWRTAVSAK